MFLRKKPYGAKLIAFVSGYVRIDKDERRDIGLCLYYTIINYYLCHICLDRQINTMDQWNYIAQVLLLLQITLV